MDLQRLKNKALQLRLFSALGAEIDDPSVARIRSWDEWLGPEDPLVEGMAKHLQRLHDDLPRLPDEGEWNRALRLVVDVVAKHVPYIEDEDAWYGPNTAAWCAAWALALEEAYIYQHQSLPAELRAQLHWFEQGHWPCALANSTGKEAVSDYVVY
jgi:hypothetical protein